MQRLHVDAEAQVAAVYGKFPHARIIGLRLPAGPAEPRTVRVDGTELPVARCDSVLALRERLTEVPDEGPPLVLLTSLREPDLGHDILARLARRGLFTVEPWQLVKERFRAQFRSEFFNAFNTPYFGQPNGIGWVSPDAIVPDAPRMGEVRGLRTPMRIVQFGLKFFF